MVMLAALDADGNTEEIIYAGTSCAARKLTARGARATAARVRDAAAAAGRVRDSAARWAQEFGALSLNAYLAANSTGLLNVTRGDVAAALALGRQRYAEMQQEVAAVQAGRLNGTRFAKLLPTL